MIDRLCPAGELDARSLSLFIAENFPAFSPSIKTKLVSNDLNRLYRMQLLSRKKMKRTVLGGEIYRGFMYVYWLNKQGRSYVEYLKRTYFHPDFEDYLKKFGLRTNPRSMIAVRQIETDIGGKLDELGETYAEYAYLHSIQQNGRHNRFPIRISFEFVKKLMAQKRKLEQENDRLISDLKVCRTQLEMAMRR